MNVTALYAEHIDIVAVGWVNVITRLCFREPLSGLWTQGIDFQHEIDGGGDLRVIGHFEVGQRRVSRHDRRDQSGVVTSGCQRRHDAVQCVAGF